jgi:hypothetical protein
LTDFHQHYPEKVRLLSSKEARKTLSEMLGDTFEMNQDNDMVIRGWIKLACLVPSVILNHKAESVDDIIMIIQKAVRELSGGFLPWE